MQSVGTTLREARIKKGYTLEDINARTRISLKNLNAIEADDLAKISSPFTYRSFVKQISEIVGVDPAALAADVQAASTTMPEPLVPGQEEETYVRPHQFQPQTKPKPVLNWFRVASVAGVLGVISIYLLWRNGGTASAKLPPSPFPASSQVVPPPQAVPASTSAVQSAAVPAVAAPAPVESKPTQTLVQQPQPPTPVTAPGTEQLLPPSQVSAKTTAPVSDSSSTQVSVVTPPTQNQDPAPIRIELSTIQSTWLSVSADGKTEYSGTLAAMQTMTFSGKETAEIRTGNAGGVNIIFNGRALGPMGRLGQSRKFVFTKSGYEVVQGLGGTAIARSPFLPVVNRN